MSRGRLSTTPTTTKGDAPVSPSYTLRRAATTGTGTATDYVQSASTEEVCLEAGGEAVGRVLVSTADLSASAVTGQRVLLTLGDHLGSTSTVIDRETGELVEAVAYTSYGQSESDVRPDRYKGLREDVRFTGNEDDVEVGLTAFAKRTYAPALGRWASPDPLAVHAPGEADADGPRAGARSPATARTLRANAGFAIVRIRGAGRSRGPRGPAIRAP